MGASRPDIILKYQTPLIFTSEFSGLNIYVRLETDLNLELKRLKVYIYIFYLFIFFEWATFKDFHCLYILFIKINQSSIVLRI